MTGASFEEELVYFPCGDISLAGVLSVPAETNGRAVLIPWGGRSFPSSARNRVRVRLARTLAEQGFHRDPRGAAFSDLTYRAGDLVEALSEGTFRYIGRRDA
jgi:hypothetical protein